MPAAPMRLHADEQIHTSRYRRPRRARPGTPDRGRRSAGGEPGDARRISPRRVRASAGRAVCCYFDNDAKAEAPFDARRLLRLLDAMQ